MAAADDDKDALLKELGHEPTVWENFQSANKPGEGVSNEDVLKKAYSQFTGREADAPGLAAHLKNPGGLEGGLKAIYGSQESQNFGRQDPSAWAGVATTPAATPPPAAGVDPAAPAAPAARRGSWGNLNLDAPTQRNINQFSGFNAERALAGADDDSVKDAFQRWAGGLDFDLRGKTKGQIGDYYKSQLQSAKDYGLDIRDVQGEKILINTKERGPEWIDSVIGAGGDNPMFGWQSDYDNIGNAALAGGVQPSQAGNPALAAAISGKDKSASDAIKAEIEALIQGGASPTDAAALVEQLQA